MLSHVGNTTYYKVLLLTRLLRYLWKNKHWQDGMDQIVWLRLHNLQMCGCIVGQMRTSGELHKYNITTRSRAICH